MKREEILASAARIAGLAERATPGPWAAEIAQGDDTQRLNPSSNIHLNSVAAWAVGPRSRSGLQAKRDAAAFIASAPEMSRLIAAMEPYVRGAGWQGIESAPKDGTVIRGWSADLEKSADVKWTGMWSYADEQHFGLPNVTHWQALPPPPDKGT